MGIVEPGYHYCVLKFASSYQDPFEDYKKRLAKKLAKRVENEISATPAVEKPKDDMNWFGTKIGSQNIALNSGRGGGSVGKYLSLKRPQEAAGNMGESGEEVVVKKKQKIGFGNFDGW